MTKKSTGKEMMAMIIIAVITAILVPLTSLAAPKVPEIRMVVEGSDAIIKTADGQTYLIGEPNDSMLYGESVIPSCSISCNEGNTYIGDYVIEISEGNFSISEKDGSTIYTSTQNLKSEVVIEVKKGWFR